MNETGQYRVGVICGCIKCGSELFLEELKPGETPKDTYDVICSECECRFQCVDRESTEAEKDTTKDKSISLEEVKRQRRLKEIRKDLKKKGLFGLKNE